MISNTAVVANLLNNSVKNVKSFKYLHGKSKNSKNTKKKCKKKYKKKLKFNEILV